MRNLEPHLVSVRVFVVGTVVVVVLVVCMFDHDRKGDQNYRGQNLVSITNLAFLPLVQNASSGSVVVPLSDAITVHIVAIIPHVIRVV